ncbi:DUF6464 family protein [Sodalinema gerasimenkoae]|uniref:DUF6464 family protein n=1 Tax=Sodalinema gerasimenkoae TaxID=2862348 RepID=UPI0013572415|nr:DUF6464 family protein [Sodalinema gerasimenkoae]
MEPDSLPTELILSESTQSLGRVYLDWTPQPGHYLDVKQQTYKVLERRHRYHLKSGRYRLHQIALYVQTAQRPEEMTCVDGHWLIGDLSCRYNARSELMRCAINPQGPCAGCRHYEPLDEPVES